SSSPLGPLEPIHRSGNNGPLISVIIPSYNHSSYLQRRIQSILQQTLQDFEIIFLDDASTDNSVSIARDLLPRDRTRFFVNKRNTRIPCRQWNKGVAAASGEFIWIAESDDFAAPTF